MARYYRIDSTKLGLGALWTIHPRKWVFLISVVRRMLGIPLNLLPLVRIEGLEKLAASELPPASQEDFEVATAKALGCGLSLGYYYRYLPDNPLNTATVQRAAVYVGPDPRFFGHHAWVRVERHGAVRVRTAFDCRSYLADGTILVTSNNRSALPRPKALRVHRMREAEPAEVIQTHLKRLAATPMQLILPIPPEGLEARILDQAQEMFDYLQGLNLLVPMEDEPATLERA
jgi:hypothetical protein